MAQHPRRAAARARPSPGHGDGTRAAAGARHPMMRRREGRGRAARLSISCAIFYTESGRGEGVRDGRFGRSADLLPSHSEDRRIFGEALAGTARAAGHRLRRAAVGSARPAGPGRPGSLQGLYRTLRRRSRPLSRDRAAHDERPARPAGPHAVALPPRPSGCRPSLPSPCRPAVVRRLRRGQAELVDDRELPGALPGHLRVRHARLHASARSVPGEAVQAVDHVGGCAIFARQGLRPGRVNARRSTASTSSAPPAP